MKRTVCYMTGTRADYGLMERTLVQIQKAPNLELGLCVTGMHLSPTFGYTVREIEKAGLPIWAKIPVNVELSDGASMANALAHELLGMTELLRSRRPDLVMLLGDRGEMLAGALAAIHQNIPIVHIHGGERSGTIDESVRHAISKLAHYHFTATVGSKERLVRMGEHATNVFVTGAPGIDEILDTVLIPRAELLERLGLDARLSVALLVYHPVLQTSELAGVEMSRILEASLGACDQVVCLTPNSDAGANKIRKAIEAHSSNRGLRILTHLPRLDYLSLLAAADVMLGNSSSGIIEAASFGTPVINIGDRQHGRERNANVTDVSIDLGAIHVAIDSALTAERFPSRNIYGDGHAGEIIVKLLTTLPLSDNLLRKSNAN